MGRASRRRGGGGSDRSAVLCSAREKRGGRRGSEREGAEKRQRGCDKRSRVGGECEVEMRGGDERFFWTCWCICSTHRAAGEAQGRAG